MAIDLQKIRIVSAHMIVVDLETVELALVLKHLEHNGWNRSDTARSLGISLRTVRNKINVLRAYGFNIPDSKYDPRVPSRQPKPKSTYKRRNWVTYEQT